MTLPPKVRDVGESLAFASTCVAVGTVGVSSAVDSANIVFQPIVKFTKAISTKRYFFIVVRFLIYLRR